MADSGLRFIYANAIPIVCLRADYLNLTANQRDFCRSISIGFGLTVSDGDSAFTDAIEDAPLTDIIGFDLSSQYHQYEQYVKTIFSSSFYSSNLSDNQKLMYVAAIHAIIFGYALNPNIELSDLSKVIGDTIVDLSSRFIGGQPFAQLQGNILHTFTVSVIQDILTSNNYSVTIAQLATSPKNNDVEVVHYNWYDTTNLFSDPNLDLMKDSENQYYYISGKLIYSEIPSDLVFCETEEIIVNTISGNITTTYIKNTPCIDEDSYKGPLTDIKFYREFNDGPYSSGDFTDNVKTAFINFDKERLFKNQYDSNAYAFYSFNQTNNDYIPIYLNKKLLDINGVYNLNREYLYAPITTGCFPKYQVMRVGDVRTRSQCTKYDQGVCIECNEFPTTGFKFVVMELDSGAWDVELGNIRTNPAGSLTGIFKRALNINNNPYIATKKDNIYQTFTYDNDLNEIWYSGPPQINGTDALPYFAFTNSFQNYTFDKRASIELFPAIGTAQANLNNDSTRSFEVSNKSILLSIDNNNYSVFNEVEQGVYPKAKFQETISSYNTNDDDTKLKFFGMGNAFSGRYSITTSEEENAGYIYTGYVIVDTGGNIVSSPIALAETATNYKLGSPVQEIKYISGYTGVNTISIAKMYAHDNSGNYLPYYFFDNRLLPNGVSVTNQTGWTQFSPLPSGLEDNPLYSRSYYTEKVENRFQRYYKGPYAVIQKQFLYPNAYVANNIYNGKINGFPKKFNYKVIVREEAVKELYAKFSISNGLVSSEPEYISLIRPDESNFGVHLDRSILMFDCNSFVCDFNQWDLKGFNYAKSLPNAVDNNYAPVLDFWYDGNDSIPITASGKNSVLYVNSPTFKQGILLTGLSDYTTHIRRFDGLDIFSQQSGELFYSITPDSVGLFHNYTGYILTGEIGYTKPIYNLEDGTLHREASLDALPIMKSGCVSYFFCDGGCSESIALGFNNLYVKNFNGKIFMSRSGQDPIYLENIGGRRGGITATTQGGYHSKGIIGDEWLGFQAKTFGYWCSNYVDVCFNSQTTNAPNIEAVAFDNRRPDLDDQLLLFNVYSSGTEIHTRAMHYNPLGLDNIISPFDSNTIISNNAGLVLSYKEDIRAYYFDLNSYFPLIDKPVVVNPADEWYMNSGSGLILGPFDRDVELFADRLSPITGYTNIYVNGQMVSDYFQGSLFNDCFVPNVISGNIVAVNAGTTLKQIHNIKTFVLIPSGETATINIRSVVRIGDSGIGAQYIGFPPNSLLHIRARETNGAMVNLTDVKVNRFGSEFWRNLFNLANNGIEKSYKIHHNNNQIEDLLSSSHSFISFTRSGKLYPKPDSDTLSNYRVLDEFGNESYSIEGIEDFYQIETAKNANTVYATGWREGSRISFTFLDIAPIYDTFPYENYVEVIPSGNCIVSGEMGYLGQADNGIYSEGIYLKDMTPKDIIKENIYGPSFVSPVLTRIPFFTYPSGDFNHPVLEAPSVMKVRRNKFKVEPTQLYSGINKISPFNYNKFMWPALSDLRTLNPEETLEEIPPDDGNTFLNSTILISASQGQKLPNGKTNPDFKKLYVTQNQFQTYDSVATDALINFKYFLTSGYGHVTHLTQPETGVLVPVGTTITDINLNLI
jgi:hypothetical protein